MVESRGRGGGGGGGPGFEADVVARPSGVVGDYNGACVEEMRRSKQISGCIMKHP
jgi:hypothetical protein